MNDDYLMQETDKNVLRNIATMGAHLKQLKIKMLEAEEKYKAASDEYESYANTILPQEMFSAGISRLDLADGSVISYERKYYCTPNKNEADKAKIAEWLRQHGGAHLIKERAAVDAAQIDKLRDARIPFTEISDYNTSSLKAFLRDKIGATGGTALISIDEIPSEIHFIEQGTVAIDF